MIDSCLDLLEAVFDVDRAPVFKPVAKCLRVLLEAEPGNILGLAPHYRYKERRFYKAWPLEPRKPSLHSLNSC